MKLFLKKKKPQTEQTETTEDNFFLDDSAESVAKVKTTTEPPKKEDSWLEEDYEEGQLSVDVYQTKDAIVIKSTIAGVKPEDIDISINNDMVTIRGKREFDDSVQEDDYFYQECYWGGFSRSIILPVEIQPDKVQANLKNGVLTITLPKVAKAKAVSIKDEEEVD